MQTRDIKIGEDYVLSNYRGIARVRVTETRVTRVKWGQPKADGVRFEFIDQVDWHSPNTLVPSREIVRPWDETAQAKLDRRRAEIATAERVEREGDELGVVAFYNGRVQIELEDWDKLVKQLRGLTAAAEMAQDDAATARGQ
jgi:hypothetical protein